MLLSTVDQLQLLTLVQHISQALGLLVFIPAILLY